MWWIVATARSNVVSKLEVDGCKRRDDVQALCVLIYMSTVS